jgi:hypothetical protein
MNAALSKKRAARATLHPPMDGCCILGLDEQLKLKTVFFSLLCFVLIRWRLI